MKLFTCFLCALLLAALPAAAETVYGRVFHTLDGQIYSGAKVTLMTRPLRQALTDKYGQYWLRDVPPGAYLVRLEVPGRRAVTGRLVVYRGTNVAHLDLSKLGAPDHDDQY